MVLLLLLVLGSDGVNGFVSSATQSEGGVVVRMRETTLASPCLDAKSLLGNAVALRQKEKKGREGKRRMNSVRMNDR